MITLLIAMMAVISGLLILSIVLLTILIRSILIDIEESADDTIGSLLNDIEEASSHD